MAKIIKESDLKRIIKGFIVEALKYDKGRRQYYPDYTGNSHSDAGKYASNYGDDHNYTRNHYKWSDPKAQEKFQKKQWQNDMEIWDSDPDWNNENNAINYLDSRKPYNLIKKASESMKSDLDNILRQFCDNAAQKFPILKNREYMSDFLYNLRDTLNDFEY